MKQIAMVLIGILVLAWAVPATAAGNNGMENNMSDELNIRNR